MDIGYDRICFKLCQSYGMGFKCDLFQYHNSSIYYDSNGKLIGTTSSKAFTDVPAKGQQEIKTKYKDYTAGPVIFYDDNEENDTDMILWGLQFNDADNYFVELTKGNSKLIIRVDTAGGISLFKQL